MAETLRGDDRPLDRPAVMAALIPDLELADRGEVVMKRIGRDLVRRLDRGKRPSGGSRNQIRRFGQRTVFVADFGARRQRNRHQSGANASVKSFVHVGSAAELIVRIRRKEPHLGDLRAGVGCH